MSLRINKLFPLFSSLQLLLELLDEVLYHGLIDFGLESEFFNKFYERMETASLPMKFL